MLEQALFAPSGINLRAVAEDENAQHDGESNRSEKNCQPLGRDAMPEKSNRLDARKSTDSLSAADAFGSCGHCCACPYSERNTMQLTLWFSCRGGEQL